MLSGRKSSREVPIRVRLNEDTMQQRFARP